MNTESQLKMMLSEKIKSNLFNIKFPEELNILNYFIVDIKPLNQNYSTPFNQNYLKMVLNIDTNGQVLSTLRKWSDNTFDISLEFFDTYTVKVFEVVYKNTEIRHKSLPFLSYKDGVDGEELELTIIVSFESDDFIEFSEDEIKEVRMKTIEEHRNKKHNIAEQNLAMYERTIDEVKELISELEDSESRVDVLKEELQVRIDEIEKLEEKTNRLSQLRRSLEELEKSKLENEEIIAKCKKEK